MTRHNDEPFDDADIDDALAAPNPPVRPGDGGNLDLWNDEQPVRKALENLSKSE